MQVKEKYSKDKLDKEAEKYAAQQINTNAFHELEKEKAMTEDMKRKLLEHKQKLEK